MEHSKSHPDDSEQAKIYIITKINSQIKKKNLKEILRFSEKIFSIWETLIQDLGHRGKQIPPSLYRIQSNFPEWRSKVL